MMRRGGGRGRERRKRGRKREREEGGEYKAKMAISEKQKAIQ